MKWLLTNVCVNNSYVVVNMDETAVQHEYEARKGFVIDMNQQERSAAGCFFSPLKMAKTRAHTTYVAFITDNIYWFSDICHNLFRQTKIERQGLKWMH